MALTNARSGETERLLLNYVEPSRAHTFRNAAARLRTRALFARDWVLSFYLFHVSASGYPQILHLEGDPWTRPASEGSSWNQR